jgi:TPR repeat protein
VPTSLAYRVVAIIQRCCASLPITVEIRFRLFPDSTNKKTSQQEDQRTRYNNAISYLRDTVTSADSSKAFRLLGPIAQAGYPPAQYSLGVLYETGEGISQNYDEAAKWYKRCADQGNAAAQYRLSVLFELGKRVREDNIQALLFAQLAAAQNFGSAPGRVAGLAAHMSAEQISKAQEMAKKWKPKKHSHRKNPPPE